MNPIYDTFKPEGFSTVNSYLFVKEPIPLIDFLKKAFYAEELHRTVRPDTGIIANCILKIGDTCFMVAQPSEGFQDMKTAHYLFTNDVDFLQKRAIEHGANEVFAPADMDYGDRQGGVIDPAGNYWWISKRLTESNY